MNIFRRHIFLFAALGALVCSCGGKVVGDGGRDVSEPRFLEIFERPEGGWTVVSVSPFDGSRDSLVIDRPFSRLVAMSTSHYGFLDALGATDRIVGISGPDYLYTALVGSRQALTASAGLAAAETSLDGETHATLGSVRGGTGAERSVASGGAERSEAVEPPELVSAIADVGYDAAPDYEKIVGLGPDVVLTYAVSGAKSPFETKLEQLGIKVFTVNEHLERHPLARAAYIRLFGALTGRMAAADSILSEVTESYNAIAAEVKDRKEAPRKVLLNIPYNDQWFVPSEDSYLTALIRDAGGEVLGCEKGKAASSVMPVEKAYTLSQEADCWLNTGWCHTRKDLLGVNPIFKDMLGNIESNAAELGYGSYPVVWNDNKRVNSKGGNDIWQSGVARPDLVLLDLAAILHPDNQGEALKTIYYRQIN